jgi:Xaa-Pro aminopeptidase
MITREDAIGKAGRALLAHRLDALVASSPPNVRYTAGTSFHTQVSIPERLALVSIARDGEPCFIYCAIEEGHAKEESWLRNMRAYTEFADTPVLVLADALRQQGVASGRVGVEERHLSHRDYSALRAALPGAELVAADAIFDRMRAIKTPAEINVLGSAAFATDAAIRAAFAQARIGMTEREIGDVMLKEARARGGGALLFQVLCTGQNGFKIHAEPGDTRLDAGGVLRTDFGLVWSGYRSDIARTAFARPLKARQADTYRRLEEVHQMVIAAMKPGVRASAIFHICTQAFAQRDVEFTAPHIGHSIGIGGHEKPMLQPFDDSVLEPGMVFMLEPLIRVEDGLYHTEDMIEITEAGQRVLGRSADWSEPMVVG